MAIYRSDQATVTFGVEAAQGGAPGDGITALTSSANITGGHNEINAGDRTITFQGGAKTATGGNLKTLIIVGNITLNDRETRRVVAGSGTATWTVDVPFGRFHAASTTASHVMQVTTANDATIDAFTGNQSYQNLTYFPGIYESVDCPDPEQAFEPRYVLGGLTNRNFYQMYAGNETLTGSIGGMVMLNGFPLRFPLGKVVTVPASAWTWATATRYVTDGAIKKGAITVALGVAEAATLVDGTYLLFGIGSSEAPASGTNYGAHITDSSKTYEIRQVIDGGFSSATSGTVLLNAPLNFDHADSERVAVTAVTLGTSEFFHTIFEQTALDSMTWNVSIADDGGSNIWQRKYVGGKVGSMTLSAEAGGLLTGGWDGVNFLDMVHNMKAHPDLPSNQPMPRYQPMQLITSSMVGVKQYVSANTVSFRRPDTAPYYYSQGSVKMFGVTSTTEAELARIASFSLSIANSSEPKFYVGAQYDGRRTPKEQYEGNREYSMSATIATNDSANQGTDDTRNLFKELLLAGDYRGTTTATGFRGFGIQLKFTRDIDGSQNDYIQIDIPGDGTAAAGGNEQGAFIRTAPHNIGEDSPISADADIVFRSMRIKIRDTEPIYP